MTLPTLNKSFQLQSALDLWQEETSLPSIPTFSQSLDKTIGNDGIQLGLLTELLGLPGSGKTQLCLQLCAAVQIPKDLQGLDAEALYIDTNTNFSILRFKEILTATLSRLQKIIGKSEELSLEKALNKFHYIDGFGLEKFCAILHSLPMCLNIYPKIRLIVIDSITFPFKEGISEKQRTGLLFKQMADLQKIAIEKQIAVIITNEMSTRPGLSGEQVVGALGDTWAHRCNKRILLSSPEGALITGERVAAILKSIDSLQNVAQFQITREGIRDVQ